MIEEIDFRPKRISNFKTSENIMNRILPLIGFFLPMLVTVTVDHLIKQPIAGEVIDSIISALFFTAVFAVGVWLGRGLKGMPPRRKGFLYGLAAGIVVQAVIWGFWLSMPESVRYSFGIWPLVGHVLLITGVGYTISRIQIGDMSGT